MQGEARDDEQCTVNLCGMYTLSLRFLGVELKDRARL